MVTGCMLAGRPVPHLITKCSLASCPAKRNRPIVAARPESRISHSSSGTVGAVASRMSVDVRRRQRLAVDAGFVDVPGESAVVVAGGRVVVHDAAAAGAQQKSRRAVRAADADRRGAADRGAVAGAELHAVEVALQAVGREASPSGRASPPHDATDRRRWHWRREQKRAACPTGDAIVPGADVQPVVVDVDVEAGG